MQTRSLGTTGLAVSPIGLGLAALGRPAYIDLGREQDFGRDRNRDAMERRCHEVLDAAFDQGIRYVDAARSYGVAEEFLASWLERRSIPPGTLTVGSKWGYTYVGGWRMEADVHEVKDHTLATLRRQIAESRALLGRWLGLYQIHSATLESGVLEDRDMLAELLRLRDEGLVVGLTVSGPRQAEVVRTALVARVDGVSPFQVVQATWNPLEPSAGPALAEAHEAGWGVLIKEAVANGRLTSHAQEPAVRTLEAIGERHGASPDQVALATALEQPWAGLVLSGAATAAQVRSNVGAIGVELTDEDRDELASLAEPAEAYWRTRSALRWS